jgi:hypothetical protein
MRWLDRLGRMAPVAVPCGLALALRVRDISVPSLWADELHVVVGTRGGLVRAVQTAAEDIYPPLHYALAALLPTNGIRLFSAACGAAAVGIAAALAHRLGGERAAWVTGIWLALLPAHVHWSQEARSYALQSLLHVALVAGVCTSMHPVALAWLAAALAYTHGLAPVWIAGIALLALALGRRDAVLGLGAGLATFLPWLTLSLSQADRYETWNTAPAGLSSLVDLLRYAGIGHHSAQWASLTAAPLLAACAVAIRSSHVGRALGLACGATVVALLSVHFGFESLMAKHFVPLAPMFAVLAGVGLARMRSTFYYGMFAILLAMPALGLALGLERFPVRFEHAGVVAASFDAGASGPIAATRPPLWRHWSGPVEIAPLPHPPNPADALAYYEWQRAVFSGRADVTWWWLQGDAQDVVGSMAELPVVWSVTSDAAWGYALTLSPGVSADTREAEREGPVVVEDDRRLGFYGNSSASVVMPASGTLRVWVTASSLGGRWPALRVGADDVHPTARIQWFDLGPVEQGSRVQIVFDDDASGPDGDLNVWVHRIEVLPAAD